MTAETCPMSLISRFAVSPQQMNVPEAYYRSKLFIANSTANPLVAAASPLLSLMERLCISPTLPAIESIRDNIEHELKAFHSRLLGQKYSEEVIVIAKYLLSATMDELLGKNYLRVHGQPAEFKAFTPYSHDDVGPQKRFFEIVHFIKERVNQYLDLLELSYYCLISGFEGEHHLRADGRLTLDNLIEDLYQTIQTHRVNKPYRLFKNKTLTTQAVKNHKVLITLAALSLGLFGLTFCLSHLLLEHKAKTVMLGHPVLAYLDQNG